jgi:hypothetical protein
MTCLAMARQYYMIITHFRANIYVLTIFWKVFCVFTSPFESKMTICGRKCGLSAIARGHQNRLLGCPKIKKSDKNFFFQKCPKCVPIRFLDVFELFLDVFNIFFFLPYLLEAYFYAYHTVICQNITWYVRHAILCMLEHFCSFLYIFGWFLEKLIFCHSV